MTTMDWALNGASFGAGIGVGIVIGAFLTYLAIDYIIRLIGKP